MVNANTSEQYYLGVDPSASSSGLGLITSVGGKPIAWSTTTIAPPKELGRAERLNYHYKSACTFLRQHNVEKISKMGIESASLGSTNRETVLSEVRGIFLLLGYQYGAGEPARFPPMQLKKYTTGNGSASKDEMLAFATKLGEWSPQNDDEGDACGAAHAAYALDHHKSAQLTRIQLEMVLQLLQGPTKKASLVKSKARLNI